MSQDDNSLCIAEEYDKKEVFLNFFALTKNCNILNHSN